MLAELTCEELAAGMDAVVVEILKEAGVYAPPVDALQLARRLGITVAVDQCQAGRARYVRLRRPPAVARPPDDPLRPGRPPRAAALGRRPRDRRARRVPGVRRLGRRPARDVAAGPRGRGQLPGRPAAVAHCLVRTRRFADRLGPLTLKSRYATASHELIARRMLECRPPAIITIFDQGAIYFRRSNLPGRVPPPSAAERECWRTVHAQNRPGSRPARSLPRPGLAGPRGGLETGILRTEGRRVSGGRLTPRRRISDGPKAQPCWSVAGFPRCSPTALQNRVEVGRHQSRLDGVAIAQRLVQRRVDGVADRVYRAVAERHVECGGMRTAEGRFALAARLEARPIAGRRDACPAVCVVVVPLILTWSLSHSLEL